MKFITFALLIIFSAVYANQLPCNCRLGNLNRIVNGKTATAHSIPWIASLSDFSSEHFCGATILNENYVLTAAHCTQGKDGNDILVRVGMQDTQVVDVQKIHFGKRIIQENFINPGDIGDFALIELKNPIKFVSGEVEPACLNLKDKDFEGDLLSAGWGLTDRIWKDADDENSKMNYPKKSTTELKYYFSTQFDFMCKQHNICLIAKNEGDGACSGDSGGPLMHTKNGKTSVIGMASFVSARKEGDKLYFCNGPTTYARASVYKNLIDEHVQNYCSE